MQLTERGGTWGRLPSQLHPSVTAHIVLFLSLSPNTQQVQCQKAPLIVQRTAFKETRLTSSKAKPDIPDEQFTFR